MPALAHIRGRRLRPGLRREQSGSSALSHSGWERGQLSVGVPGFRAALRLEPGHAPTHPLSAPSADSRDRGILVTKLDPTTDADVERGNEPILTPGRIASEHGVVGTTHQAQPWRIGTLAFLGHAFRLPDPAHYERQAARALDGSEEPRSCHHSPRKRAEAEHYRKPRQVSPKTVMSLEEGSPRIPFH
jgi:hypothetical protein